MIIAMERAELRRLRRMEPDERKARLRALGMLREGRPGVGVEATDASRWPVRAV